MLKPLKIALAGLIALAAAAALFAAAGAASDNGAQEPPAVAQQQQQQQQQNTRPTGDDWSCSKATRGHQFLGGFQRSLINHFHYQITEQEVCRNSATGATWNGPQTRRSYWRCTNMNDEVVTCPAT